MKTFSVKGDYYECGFQIGRNMKTSIRYRLSKMLKGRDIADFLPDLKKINTKCEKKYPNLIRELHGIADGSGQDYWKLLFCNSPELRQAVQGCTSLASASQGKIILAHNEDGSKGTRKKDVALVKYSIKGVTFHTFMYAGELAGNAFSWNSRHMYMSVNYLEPAKPYSVNRIPRYFTARALIEAKSIPDALKIMKSSHDASGFHYYIGKGKELLSIEQCQGSLSIKKVRGSIFHTNHYIHSQFKKFSMFSDKDSRTRYGRVKELENEVSDPLDILFDRKNVPYPIYGSSKDDLHTLCTVLFDPQKKKVTLYPKRSRRVYRSYTI